MPKTKGLLRAMRRKNAGGLCKFVGVFYSNCGIQHYRFKL